jgi:tetratricopeptide (TPR) repeat protein
MEFLTIYRDPKKKNLQRLEILVVLIALPIALIWGAKSYQVWANFQEADRLFREGDAYLHQGNIDAALQSLEQSVTIYPEHYSAWESLGATQHLKNQHDKELQIYQRAVSAVPQSGELHRELGTAYHENGEHKKELEHLLIAQQILGKEEIFTSRLLDRAQREATGDYPSPAPNAQPGAELPNLDEGLDHNHDHSGDHDGHTH